jgi:hypothetical protein
MRSRQDFFSHAFFKKEKKLREEKVQKKKK